MKQHEIAQVLLMAHGWAYNHRFFDALLGELPSALKDRTLFVCLEAGYFPEQAQPGLMIFTEGKWLHHPAETLHSLVLAHAEVPWLGLGHSLGFSKLLDFSVRWQSLYCMHGFTRFVADEVNPNGTPARLLATMIRKAQRNLPEVLSDFHARCGHNAAWASLNEEALLSDLAGLQTLNSQGLLDNVLAHGTELHVWRGTKDQIAPPNLIEACFRDALQQQHRSVYTLPAGHAELGHSPTRYTDILMPLLNGQ